MQRWQDGDNGDDGGGGFPTPDTVEVFCDATWWPIAVPQNADWPQIWRLCHRAKTD